MMSSRFTYLFKVISLSLVFSVFTLTFGVLPAHAASYTLIPNEFTFNTNLSKGTTKYPDVVYLKRFLNNDTRTALASDPCISTYTDGYFDQNTKDAVMRFQTIYRNEVLLPASTTVPTGTVGTYTRAKMNTLLDSPAYANIVTQNATLTPQASAAIQTASQYLAQVNQSLASGINNPASLATSTASSTATTTNPSIPANTNNPTVNAYLNAVNNSLLNIAATTSTTSSVSQTTTNVPIVNTYLQNVINALSNTSTSTPTSTTPVVQTPNSNTTNTYNNPAVGAYLNSINSTLANLFGQTSVTTNSTSTATSSSSTATTTATSTPSTTLPTNAPLPRVISVSPTLPTSCQQTITIIGQNFSPTQNMLVGTLGTFVTTAQTIATTSSSSIQAITFQLRDFTDYMYNQSVNAGYTKEIRMVIMANGYTSDDMIILRFTFPGEKRSAAAIAQTSTEAAINGLTDINANGGTSNPGGSTSANSSQNLQGQNQSILKTIEQTDLNFMSKTPQGMLIKAIGGEKALQTFYGFTPNGHLNQKLQGNILGGVSITNQITGKSNGSSGSSNSSSGSSNSLLSGLGGLAAGIGLAAGLSSLFGGGGASGASTGAATGNFGGVLTVNYTCTCSSNSLLTIQDVRGTTLQLIYQPGASILYAYYSLRTGANVLGDYTSGGQCLVYSGNSCTTYGSPTGTIRQIGTSK